ncbi:hypothetical protein BD413DRAFT_446116, partial [Trametes elegans]
WRCPHCAFVQRGRRTPDLKRHIRTHTRPSDPLWVCCGVPLAEAAARGVPPDVLRRQAPFEYEGVLFVGGCEREFSRRDALKRHLNKCRGECVGDACAPYLLGNKIGAR